MSAINKQKDLIVQLKKETVLNVGVLSKLKEMPQGIARQVLKENALEKPTQNVFNHLTHYLACIIDPKSSESLPWPLYDSKTERLYRNKLAGFISSNSSEGFLAPVLSSYLVNPSCYKVTLLIFQMSQLAVQKVLVSTMTKDSQKNLCKEMTAKYKSHEDDFTERATKETEKIRNKFSNYIDKRKAMEKIAEKMRKKITEMESKLLSVNAQKFLDNIVDEFISKYNVDNTTKQEIMKIKNVHNPAPFFDLWLSEVDRNIEEMESKWSEKMTPFIQICNEAKLNTELLLARHTGVAEKDTYMIEYNHKTDEICTNELQLQVNSEQKYVLKNIIKDGKLNFPNLIRGYLIAIGFILKGVETGDEIYTFNEYLKGAKRNYGEAVETMRDLIRRVIKAEGRLEPRPAHLLMLSDNFLQIPPMPDLSSLRSSRTKHDSTCQELYDSFTPIHMSKYQFNLGQRTSLHTSIRPPTKLFTPFQASEDFLKSLKPFRVNSDHMNTTQNFHNMSIIPQIDRENETIAGCSTGCTKQQLLRLLSTRKTSSSKKILRSTERSMKFKKARLFNESTSSNDSNGLFRSYSSPNLFENREVRPVQRTGRRKLSVMQESHSPLAEVSGIVALDKDSSCENSTNQSPKNVTPNIQITTSTPPATKQFHQNLKEFNVDLNKEFLTENTSKKIDFEEPLTPQYNPKMTNKTNSLEKIINRFKKIKANNRVERNTSQFEDYNECRIIVEEKENLVSPNRTSLPDLLSPSYSAVNTSEEFVVRKVQRESLGTALGVDITILDQFDLID